MVRRVIATSGSPLADWAVINDKFRAMNTSLVYGERIGCTIDNSWKLVDCIRRGRSFAEISNVEFKPEIGTWPWAPVVQVIKKTFLVPSQRACRPENLRKSRQKTREIKYCQKKIS